MRQKRWHIITFSDDKTQITSIGLIPFIFKEDAAVAAQRLRTNLITGVASDAQLIKDGFIDLGERR